jgi:hypothetical protein
MERDKFTIIDKNYTEINIKFVENRMYFEIQADDFIFFEQVSDEKIDELMDYLNYRLNN